MALSYHVDGPVLVKIGSGWTGSAFVGSLSDLCICEDGVDIAIRHYKEKLFPDSGGKYSPAELQSMGKDANISIPALSFDLTVLASLRTYGGTDGADLAPGTLLGTGGYNFRLVLASADEVWRFYNCTLEDEGAKLGTRAKVDKLNVYAWRFIPAATTTATGFKLYDHTSG